MFGCLPTRFWMILIYIMICWKNRVRWKFFVFCWFLEFSRSGAKFSIFGQNFSIFSPADMADRYHIWYQILPLGSKKHIFEQVWYITSFVEKFRNLPSLEFFSTFFWLCLFQGVCLFPTEISDIENILKISGRCFGALCTFSRPIWTSRTDFRAKNVKINY